MTWKEKLGTVKNAIISVSRGTASDPILAIIESHQQLPSGTVEAMVRNVAIENFPGGPEAFRDKLFNRYQSSTVASSAELQGRYSIIRFTDDSAKQFLSDYKTYKEHSGRPV